MKCVTPNYLKTSFKMNSMRNVKEIYFYYGYGICRAVLERINLHMRDYAHLGNRRIHTIVVVIGERVECGPPPWQQVISEPQCGFQIRCVQICKQR